MWARYEDVEEAHKDIFRWIFGGGGCTDFAKFLVEDQGVYWISGKAASGKSSLFLPKVGKLTYKKGRILSSDVLPIKLQNTNIVE